MKKFFLFTLFILLNSIVIHFNMIFASSHGYRKYYSETSSYGRDYFDDYYNGNFDGATKVQMTNTEVEFTQDDNYYCFDIKGNIELKLPSNKYLYFSDYGLRTFHIGYNNGYTLQPILYSNNNFQTIKYTDNYTKFYNNRITSAERYSNTDKTDHTITISASSEIFRYVYKNHVIIYSYKDNDVDTSLEENIVKNIVIPNVTGFSTSDGNNTAMGYNLISNNTKFTSINYSYTSSKTYYSELKGVVDCKFKILKTKISDYRYFGMGNFFLLWNGDGDFEAEKNAKNDPSYEIQTSNYTGYCTAQSIDLTNYINCEHNFIVSDNSNELTHKYICENCKWERTEEHSFIYAYEGIENNACECGYKKHIKMCIKNNINDEVKIIICKPYEAFEMIDIEKIGYQLQYIEDVVLENDKFVAASPNRIAEFPTVYDINSHIYTIVYSTNKYYLKFNKENNLSLDIGDDMEMQTVLYDKVTKIEKNKYIVHGYTFLGWALMPDINTVIYNDEEEIYNLTYEDGAVLQLYPVYSTNHYTIKYIANRGNMKTKIVSYIYGEEKELEKYDGTTPSDYSYMGWMYQGNLLKENTTKQLEKYISSNNFQIVLSAKFYHYDRNEVTEDRESKNETYIFYDNPFDDIVETVENDSDIKNGEDGFNKKNTTDLNDDNNEDEKENSDEDKNEVEEDDDIDNMVYSDNEGESGSEGGIDNDFNDGLDKKIDVDSIFKMIKSIYKSFFYSIMDIGKCIVNNILMGVRNIMTTFSMYILKLIAKILNLYKSNQLFKSFFKISINILMFMVVIYLFIILLKTINNMGLRKSKDN